MRLRRLRFLVIALLAGLAATLPGSAQPAYPLSAGIPLAPTQFAQPQGQAYGPYGQPGPGAPSTGAAPGSPLAQIEGQLAVLTATEAELETSGHEITVELEQLSERRAAATRSLRTRARALYRIERAGMLPLSGGFDAMLGHLSRLERLRRVVRSDMAALQFLRQRARALRSDAERIHERSADLGVERAGLEQRAAELREQSRIQQNYAGAFDPRLLPPLPMMQPQAAPRPQPSGPVYGQIRLSDTPRPEVSARGFATLRGELPLPVAAGGNVRPGTRDGAQVLEFQPPRGSSAMAVADGRVAFADRYRSYGMLVILDHGGGYYTLYGGLDSAAVQNGEWVGRGARVGRVGATLAFEVRRGTRALDPSAWLGL